MKVQPDSIALCSFCHNVCNSVNPPSAMLNMKRCFMSDVLDFLADDNFPSVSSFPLTSLCSLPLVISPFFSLSPADSDVFFCSSSLTSVSSNAFFSIMSLLSIAFFSASKIFFSVFQKHIMVTADYKKKF